MSKAEKLLARLCSVPKDFTWSELVAVMEKNGFTLHTGSGSGRKFIHETQQITVAMHEPHPGNIVKPYALRLAIDGLKQTGAIK
ncbi:type II toxin-antitoxin system HicA family toxin [Neisseria lisongii]|uniref:Type II toxin-antitoxin system HicA family toxin n=1 Tax=Neisseria lisongii TaxID=2912188 RepID=A0AAW5AG24_9NEIS|nr:type II toxin-antitoxin system HicA family toxin [Neisseria lisongii]MCF7530264.1 type II toxin-antitoxin system HicA family toxin [Neisseria lisongii]